MEDHTPDEEFASKPKRRPRRMKVQYVVKWSDTWGRIAERYGIDARKLAEENGVKPNSMLTAGTTLVITKEVIA